MTTVFLCPLHPREVRPCPCTRSVVDHLDLAQPAAVGLWVCDSGHEIVANPTHRGPCIEPGCSGIRRVAVAVVPSRL